MKKPLKKRGKEEVSKEEMQEFVEQEFSKNVERESKGFRLLMEGEDAKVSEKTPEELLSAYNITQNKLNKALVKLEDLQADIASLKLTIELLEDEMNEHGVAF